MYILGTAEIMVSTKKFIMVKHFDGLPKLSDFSIIEETLPSLNDGGNLYVHEYFFSGSKIFKYNFLLFFYEIFLAQVSKYA